MADRKRKGVSDDKGGLEQTRQVAQQSARRNSPTPEHHGPLRERAKAANYELPESALAPAPAPQSRYSPTPKGRYLEQEAARKAALAAASHPSSKSSTVSQSSPTPPQRSLGGTPPPPPAQSTASALRPNPSRSPVPPGRGAPPSSSRPGVSSLSGAFAPVSDSSLAAHRSSPVRIVDAGRLDAVPLLHRTPSLSSSLQPEGLTDQVTSAMSGLQPQPGSMVSALTVKLINEATERANSPYRDGQSPEMLHPSSLFQQSAMLYRSSPGPPISTSRCSPTPPSQRSFPSDSSLPVRRDGAAEASPRRSPHFVPVSHPSVLAASRDSGAVIFGSQGTPAFLQGEQRASPHPPAAERSGKIVPLTVIPNSGSGMLLQNPAEADRRPELTVVQPGRLHKLLTQTTPSLTPVVSTHSYSRPPGPRALIPTTTSTVTLGQLQSGGRISQDPNPGLPLQRIGGEFLSEASYKGARTSPISVASAGQRASAGFAVRTGGQRVSPVPVGKHSPAHRVSPVPGERQSPKHRVSPGPVGRQSPAHRASPGPTDRSGSPAHGGLRSQTPPPAHGRLTPDSGVGTRLPGVVDLSGKVSRPSSQRDRTPPPRHPPLAAASSGGDERSARRVSPVNFSSSATVTSVQVGQPVVNLTRIPAEVAQQGTVKVERDSSLAMLAHVSEVDSMWDHARDGGAGLARNKQGPDFSQGPPPLDIPGSRPVFPTSLPSKPSSSLRGVSEAGSSFNPKINPFTFPTSAIKVTATSTASETERKPSPGPVKSVSDLTAVRQGVTLNKENSKLMPRLVPECTQWNHSSEEPVPLEPQNGAQLHDALADSSVKGREDGTFSCVGHADPSKASPFNLRLQNLSNFPTSTSMYRTAYRNQSVAVQRAKHCSITSAAKSLDLLRQNLQKNINQDLDQIIQKYIEKFFKPAIANIRLNNGSNSVGEEHVHTVCRQMLEEAKKVYQTEPRRSVTPVRDISDNISETGSTGRRSYNGSRRRRGSDSDNETRTEQPVIKKKRKGRPPLHLSGRSTPSKTFKSNEPLKREGPKWDPDRLTEETQFVMGARANKALGLGATRGRLYIKHPYIFKYSGDADDKNWLYEHRLMPATRGKAYILLVEDIKDLFQTEEYRDSPALMPEELRGFKAPSWMLQKMKQQMQAMRTDVGCSNSKPSRSGASTPSELPSSVTKQSAASNTSDDADYLSVVVKEEKPPSPASLSPFNATGGFEEGPSPHGSDLDAMEEEEEVEDAAVRMPFTFTVE